MDAAGRSRWRLALAAGVVVACGGEAAPPALQDATAPPAATGGYPFVERAAETGLDFVHFNGMSGELYLSEITCGGVALLDYDGDGDLDVYFNQGRMLGPGKTLADAVVPPRYPEPLSDRLYRNDLEPLPGGGRRPRFTDVTAAAGLRSVGYGCSVATGDVDNDGDLDLYVGNIGRNQLLRNEGDGTFTDTTASAGVADGDHTTAAVAFADLDRDGWLDLFVANNVRFVYDPPPLCRDLTGAKDYCGPGSYAFEPDHLYRNRGGGTFTEASAESGIAARRPLPALGVLAADLDGDGWQDVFVANDGQPNDVWMNQGDGTFVEEGLVRGAAVNRNGETEANMGVDAGDFDNDGDLDLFVTHLIKETNTLYRNDGGGNFEDHTPASGLGPPSLPYTGWGTAWLDYDNDGWLDLLAVNGAVTRLRELVDRGDPFPLHQRKQLFRNRGDGTFEDVSGAAGPVFARSEVSRGAAFGDVDDDGDVDVVVANNNGPARLLLNEVGAARPWVGLRLLAGGRDALGARVALRRRGAPTLWRRVHTDGSYASAGDPRVLFGLGEAAEVEGVRVVWPDGAVEEWSAPPLGAYTTLRQGSGRRAAP